LPAIPEVHYISSQLSNSQQSPKSQQQNSMPAPAPPRHPTADIASLLNREDDNPTVILDEGQLQMLHDNLVKKTSGCSVEQLEQVNAALMEAIWAHRGEFNRNVVIHRVTDAFNEIIEDIQSMQKIMKASQSQQSQDSPRLHAYAYPESQPAGFRYPDSQLVSQAWDNTRTM
jgi:hypothetical protein